MSVLRSIKSLASDSLVYGLSGMLSRFIGIFLTPLYTRVYTPSDYGVIGILNNGFFLINIFLIFALDNSTARWFYESNQTEERKRIINTWFWFYLIFSISATIFLHFTASFFADIFLQEYQNSKILIRLIGLSLPFLVCTTVAIKVLRFERKPKLSVALSITQSLLIISFNVLFVLFLKKGIEGVYYAQLVATLFTLPLSYYFIKDWLGPISWFDWSKFKEMLNYALPILPAGLAFWVVNSSSVFILNNYLPKSEIGLYQIGASIAAVSGLATTSFQQAWGPFSFSIIHDENSNEVYSVALNAYVFFIGLFCAVIAIFSKETLMILTTPSYYDSSIVASILVMSYFLMGLTTIASLGLSIAKKTFPMGKISILSAVLFLFLSVWLIPLVGKEGAALAICISQLIMPIYLFYKSQQVYPISFDFRKNLLTFVILALSITLSQFLPELSIIFTIFFKLVITLVIILLILSLNRKEIDFLKEKILKRMHS